MVAHGNREEFVPAWRGLLHARCAWLALPALILGELLAHSPADKAAVAVYAVAMGVMFTASGVYHRWHGVPSRLLLLRRLDHSAIYVFVAASGTPGAILMLGGSLRVAALVLAWGAALAGIALTLLWTESPRVLRSGAYVAVGLLASFDDGGLAAHGFWGPFAFKIIGLFCYGLGAVVYATRSPDPWPKRFGFHEIFHALVVLGVLAQFAAVCWMLSGH
jgi:hemolysin III